MKRLIELSDEQVECEEDVVECVQDSCSKYELISSFHQRPQINALFWGKVNELNESALPIELMELHSTYIPDWLATILVGGYIALMSPSVFSGDLSLGKFLATTRIFKEVGETFNEGYEQFMDLTNTIGALQRLTVILNSATNLSQQKIINR